MWRGYYPCFLAINHVYVGFAKGGPDVKGVVWILPLFLSHQPCTCRVRDRKWDLDVSFMGHSFVNSW